MYKLQRNLSRPRRSWPVGSRMGVRKAGAVITSHDLPCGMSRLVDAPFGCRATKRNAPIICFPTLNFPSFCSWIGVLIPRISEIRAGQGSGTAAPPCRNSLFLVTQLGPPFLNVRFRVPHAVYGNGEAVHQGPGIGLQPIDRADSIGKFASTVCVGRDDGLAGEIVGFKECVQDHRYVCPTSWDIR